MEKIKKDRSAYFKKWRQDNKDKCCLYSKKWRDNNKEKVREYKEDYIKDNLDKYKVWNKKYSSKNRSKINSRIKERLLSNPLSICKEKIRGILKQSIRNKGYSKNSTTQKILGCSFDDFKLYIEKQFKPGMSWDNRSEWHLDHKTPISWAKSEEEIYQLNHYTNFQPLWAIENRKKGNRYETII